MRNVKSIKNVTAFLKHPRICSLHFRFPLPGSDYPFLHIFHCHVRRPPIFQQKRLDLSRAKLLLREMQLGFNRPARQSFRIPGPINQDGCDHYADMTPSSRKDKRMCNDCLKIPLDYMPDAFKVEYRQPVVDVYASLVRSSLQASRKLNILTACHDRSNLVNRTWVPDWTTATSEELGDFCLAPISSSRV
jgi:hypothetical protein